MRFGLPHNTRRSATLEHREARANGGNYDLENLVLCHKGCNKHLGTNTPEQKERMRTAKARAQTQGGLRPDSKAKHQ